MLISHNVEVGIHLYADIPASMEKRVYQTSIVTTSKDHYVANALANVDPKTINASYVFITTHC
jgi:hypothetical protein